MSLAEEESRPLLDTDLSSVSTAAMSGPPDDAHFLAKGTGSILVYGEHQYAHDVPAAKQRAANYLWIGWLGVLGTVCRLALGANTAAGDEPYNLGLFAVLWVNALACFLYGVVARHWFATNTPALYAGLTTGFCGCLSTFSGWALATATFVTRDDITRAILSIVVPLYVNQGMLELGLFLGDALEDRAAPLRAGDHEMAPEVALPRYHTHKRDVGAVLLVLLVAIAIVTFFAAGPTWLHEPAAAAALAPLGAWLRYAMAPLSRGAKLPWGTLAANALATLVAAALVLATDGTKGADPFMSAAVDGFCGGLSTTATFISEFRLMRDNEESRHRGYAYAALTLFVGQLLSIPLLAARPLV